MAPAPKPPPGLKVKTVFFVVGILFVLLFLVRSDTLTGRLCANNWCLGTLNGGVHAGDEQSFGVTPDLATP